MLRMCNHLNVEKMKGVIIVVVAFGVISGALTTAQKEMIKHAPVAQSLSPENIEALRAFKQLGFDDQHAPGRIRQSDIAVHHVYHDPNLSNNNYKPYSSSKYGSSSSREHSSSSFQSSPYLKTHEDKKNKVIGISSMWPNNGKTEMSNNGYQHQSRSHPNDILSNMGVELPSEQILGKHYFSLY